MRKTPFGHTVAQQWNSIERLFMTHTLAFVFPQWQGAGDKALYHGALEMKKLLTLPQIKQVSDSLSGNLTTKNGIIGYDAITEQLTAARTVLEQDYWDKILSIGGGCDIEMLPVSYLNQKHGGDLAVVWFDSHGDLNTPKSSPSCLFHGMPLRCLLGDGDEQLRQSCFSFLTPHQIVMAGCRDLDAPEQAYIDANNIACVSVGEIEAGGTLVDTLIAKSYRHVYIHIDLDVLNPKEFPDVMCPTSGGLSVDMFVKTLKDLQSHFDIAGASIVEYVPGRKGSIKALREIISCCESLLAD